MHYEVQTILFHKDDYDIKKAKKWLKDHEYKYISHDEIDFYIRFTLTEQNFLKYISRKLINNITLIFGLRPE